MIKTWLIVVAIWMVYATILKRHSTKYWISKSLLPLLLLWLLITVDMAVNYLGASIPSINDGIGLHGVFTYLIVGDEGWSLRLFERLYHEAVYLSLALIVGYSVMLVVEGKQDK